MNGTSILGLGRIFLLFIAVAMGGPYASSTTAEDGPAEAVVAFIAERREEAPVLDLLELHLLEHEGIVAVERNVSTTFCESMLWPRCWERSTPKIAFAWEVCWAAICC